MFESTDDVGEKIPSLRCNRLRHCKCAIDPLNTGDGLNECKLLYPDRLQAHRIEQMGVTHQISHFAPCLWPDFLNAAKIFLKYAPIAQKI
jgi:hypothetical protein